VVVVGVVVVGVVVVVVVLVVVVLVVVVLVVVVLVVASDTLRSVGLLWPKVRTPRSWPPPTRHVVAEGQKSAENG